MLTRFIMIAGALNAYSDGSRLFTKIDGDTALCEGNKDDASAKFDLGLLLFGIHHILEYIRILVLWVVSMIGINLMTIYYFTSFSTVIGLIAFIVSIIEVAGAGGC
jgi:hypothetical protein